MSQKPPSTAIQPTREEDFAEWYQQVVRAAEMAESSDVRGCMIIKPWGYALWENIQDELDRRFKATGHRNAYFPLFIPLSYLAKEAEHVEGFAKECAVVTHHRLEQNSEGKLVPASPLTEPLVVRPTSETIIGAAFAKWVQSYRDLPILINQWANVVRWEMRPRLFLRTAEFLWQEGHTAHETADEALAETRQMLEVYRDFAEEFLAMPVLTGEKSAGERFPGAVTTLCVEAMAQDRRAIQAGTSHFLGQNFAKASDIRFLSREGKEEHAWTSSWGVSTRLIGALIMTHADDDGMVLPPRIAPSHAVILPITPKPDTADAVLDAARELAGKLRQQTAFGEPLRVEIDQRDIPGGPRNWEWIKKGVPLRVEIGPRDLEKNSVAVSARHLGPKNKEFLPVDEFLKKAGAMLEEMQQILFQRAFAFRELHTRDIREMSEFREYFTPANTEKPEIHGGFALVWWDGSADDEAMLKSDLKVTLRCLLPHSGDESGSCILTGRPTAQRAVFAKAY